MPRTFLKWLNQGKKPAMASVVALLVLVLGFYAYKLFISLNGLPPPTSEKAIGWWDYWLFRYQTIIAGVLAIVGAAFAIYAAKLSIWYDRKKVEQAYDQGWRKSLGAVLGALAYAQNVIISKRQLVRDSTVFPEDVYPAVLLEASILEHVTTSNLKEMPANLSMRCFHIAFSMQFANNILNTNISQKLVASRRDELRQGLLAYLQRTLLCSDIVSFHLKYLINAPRDEWREDHFDMITWDLLEPLMENRKVPRAEVEVLMKEMKINIVPPGAEKVRVSGMPND